MNTSIETYLTLSKASVMISLPLNVAGEDTMLLISGRRA